ncbi:MAG: DnaJ domain-containing protein [Chloroflexi bacterium]|nr:DnaJ domain-containing protein [Chloroflexota bacterium]
MTNLPQVKNYYKILQIDPSAEPEMVETAYRRLARKYHPDQNNSADATARMQDLNEAYEILSDVGKRAAYDRDFFAPEQSSVGPAQTYPRRPTETTYQTTYQREAQTNVEQTAVDTMTEKLYCANHPNVETLLRCNKCNKPICTKCAVRTAVGFRCKECIRAQQGIYYNAETWDNPIALVVSFVVTLIATPIAGRLLGAFGFLGIILALVIGSGAGGLLAQIIRAAVRRRRGRLLPYFALTGIIFGLLGGSVLAALFGFGFPLFSLPLLIFAFLVTTTAYQILR